MTGVTSAAFVGRDTELARLSELLGMSQRGEMRVALISGEAGIGKSRLLREFLEGLPEPVLALQGSCLPLEEAALPYAPFVEMLRSLVRQPEAGWVTDALHDAGIELGVLIPDLQARPVEPMHAPKADITAQARLFESVMGVFHRSASHAPLVLAIEDIHWSDASSRDLLAFLARNLRRSPVLLVLTMRTDDLPDEEPILSFVTELARLPWTAHLELSRFGRAVVRSLVASLTGTSPAPAVIDRVLERSDGNAFFVEQLVAANLTVGEVPSRLVDILQRRLQRLSERARQVLRVVAAAGRNIDEALIADASGMDPTLVESALRELVRAKVLVPSRSADTEPGYVFHHALLREVVETELMPAERRRLHRAFAGALDGRVSDGGVGSSPHPSELAFHWQAAGEWDRALTAHLDAARSAETVFAWTSAVRHYREALSILGRTSGVHLDAGIDEPEILHRAATAAYLAGDHDSAIVWGRAAIAAVGDADPARAGAFHERLRWYLWDSGDRPAAVASVQEALRLIPADPPSRARAAALGQWASVLMHSGRPIEAKATAKEALDMARAVGSRVDEGVARAVDGWVDVVLGNVDGGFSALRDAVEIAEDAGDFSGMALGSALLSFMADWVGRLPESRDAAWQGYQKVVAHGVQRIYGPTLLGHAVSALIALGDWDEADRLVARGFEDDPERQTAQLLRIMRARLHAARAEWDAAAVDLAEARRQEDASRGTEYGDVLLAAEAELAAWMGDMAAVRRARMRLAERSPSAPPGPALHWAICQIAMAEADEAERVTSLGGGHHEEGPLSAVNALGAFMPPTSGGRPAEPAQRRSPRDAALLALIQAEQARASGTDDVDAWHHLAESWDRTSNPFQAAYARFREACAVLRGGGDRAIAADLLAEAQVTSARLNARALDQRIQLAAGDARLVLASQITEAGRASRARSDAERLSHGLRIHAIGPLRVERDGVAIQRWGGEKAGSRQALALFGFLFDRGERGVAKEEAIDLIWPEIPVDSADQSFHRTLAGLRSTLDGRRRHGKQSAVRFFQDRYHLNPQVISWADVDVFEAAIERAGEATSLQARLQNLETARRLYRGEYLDDCPIYGDSADVEQRRRTLHDRFVDLLVDLGDLYEQRGDRTAAVTVFRQALETSGDACPRAHEGLRRLGGFS